MAQSDRLSFNCTALVGTNKVGNLKRDADGYYEVVLGALDVYNFSGQYYPSSGVKELFMESSSFVRRVRRAALRCEYGHPKREGGMSMPEYANRLTQIWEHMVCCHIKDVWLETQKVKDANGRTVIAIMGKIKPAATPYGLALEKQLENPHENVCFSIRAVTHDTMVRGRYEKAIKEVITWDYVNEPGIAAANKYSCPSLESIDGNTSFAGAETLTDLAVPVTALEAYVAQQDAAPYNVALESAEDCSLKQLLQRHHHAVSAKPTARPGSSAW
jgi:hypothetical protein